MRTHLRLIDIKYAVFKMRQLKGVYLSDTTYYDLSQEAVDEIEESALLLLHSEMEIRLVVRRGKRVARFMNKNGL